ncbi:MAG TPA: alpha-amylase family glycosyl hydrolase, partial [Verrucomicrobiae bacterium]|nr:alpha-amylase family glycosyl hydrolase [Verrucomicrobiae bacterium]
MKGIVRVVLFATGLVMAGQRLASAASFPSPDDWRDENIYFIFTDRFADGDPSNNNADSSFGSSYAPSDAHGIHGGDLKGIEKKMDYIKALGATAIWITPIPLNVGGSSAYHGYGARDFNMLAPHLGTMTDLSNMVAAAHARGIKVILDIVCNHSGDLIGSSDSGFPNFKPPPGYNIRYNNSSIQHAPPFLTNSAAPALTNIFHNNGAIQDYGQTQQVVLGELSSLDDFATETTYVRTNMVNVYTNWVGRADLDGFRVDTVKHVDYGFWQYWCPQLHQFGNSIGKSNYFMFGEVFNSGTGDDPFVGSYTGTKGGGPYKLDSVLDYVLYGRINPVFATASGNTKQIEDHYANITGNYDSNAWYRLVTFLDNHDNSRFLSNASN